MKNHIYIWIGVAVILLGAVAYAGWYSFDRQTKIAQAQMCNDTLINPPKPEMVPAPDGTLAPLYSINTCAAVVVPPSLWDLLRGRIVFENVPKRMKINSYSLTDILFGQYTFGPAFTSGCDQSATTTDCSTLPASSQSEPQPYVPPNPVQPDETWVSAKGTPISLAGFSFELPVGWHGSVYSNAYLGNVHVLVQKDSNDRGFTIDCPPDGKGLEAATRLSSEERSFISGDGTTYSVAFEKWTAPGNDPWYFIWMRMPQSGASSNGSSGTYCLVQGTVTPDIEEAMRTMYESLK